MRKYPVSLERCAQCQSWICNVVCPGCGETFHAQNVSAVWMEELEAGDDDESGVEGLPLECVFCGWTGAVDEFKKQAANGTRSFEIDSDER